MTRSDDGSHNESQVIGQPPRPCGVLVVDDNEDIRAVLRAGLGASGFAVWLAADGYEGTAVYQEHGPTIGLLLLDVCMPGRDGPETLAAIRALNPHIPCCFMSGDLGEYTEQQLLSMGAAAVFYKPVRFTELVSHVRRLITPIELQEA
jgi:two-component system OmpR family response regulator